MTTFRLLSSSDHHWDQDSPRWAECVRVHQWMVDLARRSKIDAFSSSGDLNERGSSPFERKTYTDEFVLPMADVCPSIYVRGNHDQHYDCEILSKLKSTHPIYVEERSSVIRVAGAAFAALAWPERSSLLPALGARENTYENLYDATIETLRRLGSELATHDGPRIFLSHLAVEGSVYSVGQPTIGVPISIKPKSLAETQAAFGAIGHVHKGQMLPVGKGKFLYPGSPFRTDYGQTERKCVVIATFEDATLVNIELVDTPCAAMVHFEFTWDAKRQVFREGEAVVIPGALRSFENSEVRVRYRVDKDQREAADRVAREIADNMRRRGATLVKPEEIVNTVHRARAPEVAAAQGIRAKLEAHWASVGFDPGPRREPLFAKAAEAERQSRQL